MARRSDEEKKKEKEKKGEPDGAVRSEQPSKESGNIWGTRRCTIGIEMARKKVEFGHLKVGVWI